MTKENILKYCIFALSLLSFFAATSVYAEEDCSEALIRALTEEGLSEQQIDTICIKVKQYSKPEIRPDSKPEIRPDGKPEIKLSAIEETARTVVQALIDADDELLRKLYSHNNRFFLRNLSNYYPDFNSTRLDDYDFDIEGNIVIITRYSDRNIKFKLYMVNKGNDEYLWEEIRRVSIDKSQDKGRKSLFDYFFDEEKGYDPGKEPKE
jgi:hypothetical protein